MIPRRAVPLLALILLAFAPHQGNGPGREISKPTGGTPPAGLWKKAVEVYRQNSDLYPAKIAILSEVLNRHSQPYSITELFFTIHMDSDGQMRTLLTRALKNGEDTTEKMKNKVEIRSQKKKIEITPQEDDALTVSLFDSPFDPERQGAITFHTDGEKVTIFKHLCQRYDFTYRTEITHNGKIKKLDWTGMAWLEEGSGTPVKLEFTLSPLPKRIRSLWTIYSYDVAQAGKWVVKNVQMTGHGGFLFIKKRFRVSTVFSDFRRQPKREDKK
jgi:hypothetical protein